MTQPYQIGSNASFDYVGFNGRWLSDDVMDVMLSLMTNSAFGDGVAPDRTVSIKTFRVRGQQSAYRTVAVAHANNDVREGGREQMTTTNSIDAGVAHHIGHYADAVRVPTGYDHIYVSGTPGLTPDGTVPTTITDQARQAWRNVADILSRAGASLTDIVSVRQWLTNARDVDAYVAVRSEFIHHEPAAMLAVVTGLVWPNIAVEIEVIAARPATG